MKKIVIVLVLILAVSVSASCADNSGRVTITPIPADTPAQASSPAATAEPSPEDTPQHLIKEDVPAYLTVGLQKRSEMPPEWERFYYDSYYWQISFGPYSDQAEDEPEYDTDIMEKLSIDLDGDGKEENITLIGGKVYDYDSGYEYPDDTEYEDPDPEYSDTTTDDGEEVDEDPYIMYSDITIDIDGNKLNLKDDGGLPFTLDGTVIDIDKSDGKKEMLIEASEEFEGVTDYIISYDDKKPRKIFAGNLSYSYFGIGTGYIMTSEDLLSNGGEYNYISYYQLWKLKSDRSGFEIADCKYYPTYYQQSCWDENGNWDETQAIPAQWDQEVYKEPGGSGKVLIEEGTPVFLGLYAKKSWLMLLSAKGELLGWLNADKVDFVEYTNYAFEPEGD